MLAEDPKSKIFCPLAQIYRLQKQFGLAEQTCQNGLKHNPNYAIGYITLAKVYVDQKKMDPALETIKKAKAISPDNHQIYEVLVKVYKEKKDLEKTLAAYKMLSFIKPWDKKVTKNVQHLEKMLSFQKDKGIQPSLDHKVAKATSRQDNKQTRQVQYLQKILKNIEHTISQNTLKEL